MRLIATRSLVYGGQRLQAGDAFEARPGDVKVLKAIKSASDAPPAPEPKAEKPDKADTGRYQTRRLKAEDD